MKDDDAMLCRLFSYGDIVPVTNAGQMMTIVLMLMGIFYMAMPLTASATTFYKVHEEYQDKYKLLESAQTSTQEVIQKTDVQPQGNKVLSESSSPPGQNFDAKGDSKQITAEGPKGIPGDKLERRLKKRLELFLNELYLTHAAMLDLFKDLHAKSSQFDDADEEQQQEDDDEHEYRSPGVVKINGTHVPVLRSLSSSTQASPLLERVLRLVDRADSLLTGSEDDIVRVVVLHHKLSKSF